MDKEKGNNQVIYNYPLQYFSNSPTSNKSCYLSLNIEQKFDTIEFEI